MAGFKRKPIYQFADQDSTGLDTIPDGSIVIVKSFNGAVKQLVKSDAGGDIASGDSIATVVTNGKAISEVDAKVAAAVQVDVPADAVFTDTVYTHPDTAGNKHVPAGGAANQVLTYDSDGVAVWADPAGNGTVDVVSNVATSVILGRKTAGDGDSEELSVTDVQTLINVADGATNTVDLTVDGAGTVHANNYTDTVYTHPTGSGSNHVPADGAANQVLTYDSAGTAVWGDIPASAVDVVSNVATNVILGRKTADAGDSEELSVADVQTLINVADGATNTVDLTVDGAGTVHTNNYTNTTYVAATPGTDGTDGADGLLEDSDKFKLDALIDLTVDQAGVVVHANNYTDTTYTVGDGELSEKNYVAADKDKVGYLTVTASTNLDSMRSRVAELDASVVLKGVYDASTADFPTSTNSGESWIISVDGTTDSVEFNVGDRLVALVDGASTSTYADNWLKLDYTDKVSSVAGRTGTVVLTGADVGITASGNLVATDAQGGLDELQGDIDVLNGDNTVAGSVDKKIKDNDTTTKTTSAILVATVDGDLEVTIDNIAGNELTVLLEGYPVDEDSGNGWTRTDTAVTVKNVSTHEQVCVIAYNR